MAFARRLAYSHMICLLVLLCPWEVTVADEIRWFQHHAPPMYVLNKDQPATGMVNELIDFFALKLPQYRTKRTVMTSKRFWHEQTLGNNYCRVDTIKTVQRQQWTVFTIPLSFSPPARIVMHELDWQALGKPDVLSLAALLQNRDYRGAALAKASFGANIDAVFQRSGDTDNFRRKTAKPKALLGMVNLRRIHYSIEFPIYVHNYLVQNPEHPLRQIKIQEEVDYYPLHIACTKNDWGKAIVKDLNKVLLEYRFKDEIMAMVRCDGQAFEEDIFRQFVRDYAIDGELVTQ